MCVRQKERRDISFLSFLLPERSRGSKESAFAFIRADGSVVTWGDQWEGGDCSDVQDQGFKV